MPTLRRQRDLDRVFQSGQWRRLRPVAVGTYHREDGEPTRFAFIAGRRIGNAVRRNRARRRMREALRLMLPEVRAGADVVLAARHDTPEIDFRTLQKAIRSALDAEGLLQTECAPADKRRNRMT
ncbi:MAG: ribonuclease P protein component [Armatimonadota bacterium]